MNAIIFTLSLAFLGIFIWYLATLQDRLKRWLAIVLTGLLLGISVLSLIDFEKLSSGAKEEVDGTTPWPAWVRINPGIGISGGTQFLLLIKGEQLAESDIDQVVGVLSRRLDPNGTKEILFQPTGENRIIIQIPRLKETEKESVRTTLMQVAKLEFRMVHPQSSSILGEYNAGNMNALPVGYEITEFRETTPQGDPIKSEIVVKRRAYLTGKAVKSAWPDYDQLGMIDITLQMNSANDFGVTSKRIIDESAAMGAEGRMAIVLDGVVYSALGFKNNQPIFNSSVTIDGNFQLEEARELCAVLKNPLGNEVKILDERGVDPTLGAESVRNGFQAAIYGFIAVIAFMLLYYRLAGVFGVTALLLNLVIMMGMLSQFGFTLTLPGMAAIILTIGMAVDANVLIFERIREELDQGHTIVQAVKSGFGKAFSSILDANVTTLLAAIILFWQGTGAIKGFAVMLCLGILGSLFAALVVTRAGFDWALSTSSISNIRITHFLSKTTFNFMSKRPMAVVISSILILGSIVTMWSKGNDALGVDFVGGDMMTLSFNPEQRVPDDVLKEASSINGVVTQYQSDGAGENELLVLRAPENQAEPAWEELKEKFPEAQFERQSLDRVSPTIGNEFKESALTALICGLVAIFLYIVWRFEFSFAVGAIVALTHDVLIALGLYVLAGHQFTLITVGAILTVAGYSINDTIIVFDRIREGIRQKAAKSLGDIINISINATLSRTLLTSVTTLLAVLSLYLFGGVVINDFSLMLLIGILIGTYSSIFVASPIVLLFGEKSTRDSVKRADELKAEAKGQA
ncbi:MAG: protein translocase subunit SecD [Verrucomicrobiota bacterium]